MRGNKMGLLAVAFMCVCGVARSAPIVYAVDINIKGLVVTGTITTDGTIGVLAPGNFLSWQFAVNGTLTLDSSIPGSAVYCAPAGCGDADAVSLEMTDGSYLEFASPVPDGFGTALTFLPACITLYPPSAGCPRLPHGGGVVARIAPYPIGTGSGANAQMVLYDNFDTGVINPSKWVGEQFFDPDIREALRELAPAQNVPQAKQRLHLMHRAYSATTDDNGSSGGLFGLSFPNPSAITAISFQLVVNQLGVGACSTNPGIGGTSAEFRGSFFSADASPTSSNDHDVVADIGIGTVQQSGVIVTGFVAEYNGTVLGYQELGTVALGSTNTLFLQWDQPNHRFIFQLNNGAQVFEPYSVSDTSPPFYPFKGIALARVVPHCTSTPRPFVVLDADFDNVYVNQ
jgi:hypothetical protein